MIYDLLQTSDFGLRLSVLRPPSSVFRPLSSVLGPPSSDFSVSAYQYFSILPPETVGSIYEIADPHASN